MITEIVKRSGKASIYFDGICRIRTRARDVEKCGLCVGDEFEPEECIDKLAAVQYSDCYEAALSILDVSAQTGKRIISRLAAKGFVEPVCRAVAERLEEIGLIDDQRYAERMAAALMEKPEGVHSVRRKLTARGISGEIAESMMENFDEQQQAAACRRACSTLIRKYRDADRWTALQKICQSLARKGFAWDICRETAESMLAEENDY